MAVKLLLEEDKINFSLDDEGNIDFSKIEVINISCKGLKEDGTLEHLDKKKFKKLKI